MTINLFSLYLMNFMIHTMLDATGVVLRVHYKSMKCDVLFSQGSVCTIFRWGGHLSYMSKKNYSSLQQCKNYKNWSRFSEVMVTNVLPPFFMVHSVHVYHIMLQKCNKLKLTGVLFCAMPSMNEVQIFMCLFPMLRTH